MRFLPMFLLLGCSEYSYNQPPERPDLGDDEETPAADGTGTTDTATPTDTSDPANDETPPPPAEEEEDDSWFPDWWPDDWTDADTGADSGFDPWSFDIPVDTDLPTATAAIYVNDSSNLYTYDLSTDTVSYVGAFREQSSGAACNWMVDIAIDNQGHLYGTCGNELVQIDPTNGQFVHALTLDQEYVGLTFLSNGKLVLAGNGELRIWDPSSNAVSVLNDGTDYVTSGDLVGLPDGKLYWTVTGGDDLVRLDANNGNTTWVGATSSGWDYQIWGVAWAEGQLFGFTSDGKVLQISATTGHVTLRATQSTSFYGAAANPVTW